MKEMIIINRMYAGKYIMEGQNIGHEIINLIRTDDGENFLWLNADGNCQASMFQGYDKVTMLMVRMFGQRKWKVIGKADIDLEHLKDYMVPNFGHQAHERQCKVIKEKNITYGQYRLDEIFDKNLFNGKLQNDIDIYLTFRALDVRIPKQSKENMEKTIIPIENIQGLSKQSLRMYLCPEKNDATYTYFKNIADGRLFAWEEENRTPKVKDMNWPEDLERDYFLKVIREEDRELAFSNLLAYFLESPWILEGFVRNVLGVENFIGKGAAVTREEKNIDLFISSPSHLLILENKIHSGLIVKSGNMEKKIREYFKLKKDDPITGTALELLNKFSEREEHTQIDRYYAYAKSVAEADAQERVIKGFVIAPDYGCYGIAKELDEHTLFRSAYDEPIPYSKLYNYFDAIQCDERLTAIQRNYLKEYLWAMEKHKKEIDNNLEEEMKYRFYQKVQAANQE